MEILGIFILLFIIFPLWDRLVYGKEYNPYPECQDVEDKY